MTQQQKKAINILNRLVYEIGTSAITEDVYFLLVDFVMKDDGVSYVPYNPTWYQSYPQVDYDATTKIK